jgi:hypothetical protein
LKQDIRTDHQPRYSPKYQQIIKKLAHHISLENPNEGRSGEEHGNSALLTVYYPGVWPNLRTVQWVSTECQLSSA